MNKKNIQWCFECTGCFFSYIELQIPSPKVAAPIAIITKSTGMINAQTGFSNPPIKKRTPNPIIAIPAINSAPMLSISLKFRLHYKNY